MYASTIGNNNTVATNIINKVTWLEELSQTIKLYLGFEEEGNMKGNILTPTVAIKVPTLNPLSTKANTLLFAKIIAKKADIMHKTGTKSDTGYSL